MYLRPLPCTKCHKKCKKLLPSYFQHKLRYEKCRWNNGFSFSFSYFPPIHSLIHWWPKTSSSSTLVFVTRRLPRFPPPNDRNFWALHNELPKEFSPPAKRGKQVPFLFSFTCHADHWIALRTKRVTLNENENVITHVRGWTSTTVNWWIVFTGGSFKM